MIIKDNMANMCAKVTSTYMEFTLAFGPKPEFSFSFKLILLPLQVGDELQKTKEHLFCNAIHGIIESVDKVKDQKRTVFMEKIDHNAHSVYLMYYHLIMVVKYRRKVINDPISERAKEIWEYIAPRYGIVLEEWNHDIDHVHVMFRAQPKTELSKFINAYKSASSRLLKKEYPEIREKLWKEAFWSQSFCLLTAGGAPVEVIRQYIETQGEKKH